MRYSSSASKYFSQNQNMFYLTDVIHVSLVLSWQVSQSNERLKNIRVIKALSNHHLIILQIYAVFCIK